MVDIIGGQLLSAINACDSQVNENILFVFSKLFLDLDRVAARKKTIQSIIIKLSHGWYSHNLKSFPTFWQKNRQFVRIFYSFGPIATVES